MPDLGATKDTTTVSIDRGIRSTTNSGDFPHDQAVHQTLEDQVTDLVEQVVGWPSPGIRFTDVSRILERHPGVFLALLDRLCDHYRESPPEVIMPIEARGFIYGGAMAVRLGCRVVFARKGPRLPRPVVEQDFGSGYERGLVIGAHEDAIDIGDGVLVVDDVLAAGWTDAPLFAAVTTLTSQAAPALQFRRRGITP